MLEYEEKARNAIETIDSSLELIKIFRGSTLVCKVKKGDSYYILKVANYQKSINTLSQEDNSISDFKWKINHLEREKRLLNLASGVEGITHLVQEYSYSRGMYRVPILKEFYDGEDLRILNKKIGDSITQRKLEKTIRELHKLKIAGLDIKPSNIVLSPKDDKGVCIIDFVDSYLEETLSPSRLRYLKSKDLHDLERLIFK